jgi:phospholipid/cholesterol/gamma-HCH transport system permease protein
MIIREGGSTITALIVICRICPGITSSIALKKETEQLDAYKMIGIDIVEFIILPIVVATFLTLILLSLLSTITALFVSMITCYTHLGISAQNLWHALEFFITKADIISSLVKVIVYGTFIPVVAAYSGLSCGSGATEIGKATTKSIVEAGVMVITFDLVLTWLFRFFQ